MQLPLQLAMKLAPVLRSTRAEIGLAFRHHATGETWTQNDRRFAAGDLERLPLALAAYHAAARGKIQLAKTVEWPGQPPQGAASAKARAIGTTGVTGTDADRVTIRDLIRLTLEGQDRIAPVLLAQQLDFIEANAVLSGWGLACTMLDGPHREDVERVTTPNEMAILLGLLLDGDDLPVVFRQEVLSFMRLRQAPTPLRKLALPADPAHLEAKGDGFRHLAYLKSGHGGYLLVILAEGRTGSAAISKIVSTVDAHYAGIHENQGRVLSALESQRAILAPDARTAAWDVQPVWRDGKVHLLGRVSAQEWPAVVEVCRQASDVPIVDGVKRLGATPPWAIALSPVVHLRKDPSHASELVSQVVMGASLEVLESGEEWWQVRSPDGTLAWARCTNLQPATDRDAERWRTRDQVLITSPLAVVRRLTHGTVILGAGTRLAFMGRHKDGLLGRTPGREEVLIPPDTCRFLPGGKTSRTASADDLIGLAMPFLGVPYVWGGTSGWGLDCSGLTQLVFHMGGIRMPRDSDQQMSLAKGIHAVRHVKDLLPGDLVFFKGHVGIALDRGDFIHASAPAGCVTVNALVPGAPHYASSLVKRFLGGGRMLGSGQDLAVEGKPSASLAPTRRPF